MDIVDTFVGGGGLALVLAVIFLAGVAVFLIDKSRHNRSMAEEIAAIRNDPKVVAGVASAKVDAAQVQAWAEREFATLRAKINAAVATPAPPLVGQTFADVWDVAFAVANLPNAIVVNGETIRSGTSPVMTFKTMPIVPPATKASVVRES